MRKRRTRRGSDRARKLALATILLVPVVGFSAWLAFAVASDGAAKLEPILSEYGYTALTPPSQFFGPGTFVLVEPLKDGTLKLHLACNMDHTALAAMWQRSTTLDQTLVSKVKDTFESSADALKLVKLNAKGVTARDVDIALHDISILTMPYEALFGVRTRYLKGTCEEAIVLNLRAGAMVCQTEEALEADILYRAKSEDELGGGLEVRLSDQAGATAKADRRASDGNEAKGDDLILGVRVRSSNCFVLEKTGQRLAGIGD
jgi:hypothetical protein